MGVSSCRSARQIPIPIASRPHCKHLPRMTPGFGAGLVIETRSLPALARCYPCSFTFYVADPSAPFPICGNRRQCARCNREKTWWCRRRQDRARLTSSSCFIRTSKLRRCSPSRPAHWLTINYRNGARAAIGWMNCARCFCEPPAHRRASCVLPSLIQRLQSPSRTDIRPRNPMSEVSDQLPAAAFARARWLHATRKAFISARSTAIRVAIPLYFFVMPLTVRLTAPWWTRP